MEVSDQCDQSVYSQGRGLGKMGLIFHEGQAHLVPRDAPDNVRFFDLGTGGLAQLFGLQLGEALELPIRNASVVIKAMRFMFEK